MGFITCLYILKWNMFVGDIRFWVLIKIKCNQMIQSIMNEPKAAVMNSRVWGHVPSWIWFAPTDRTAPTKSSKKDTKVLVLLSYPFSQDPAGPASVLFTWNCSHHVAIDQRFLRGALPSGHKTERRLPVKRRQLGRLKQIRASSERLVSPHEVVASPPADSLPTQWSVRSHTHQWLPRMPRIIVSQEFLLRFGSSLTSPNQVKLIKFWFLINRLKFVIPIWFLFFFSFLNLFSVFNTRCLMVYWLILVWGQELCFRT